MFRPQLVFIALCLSLFLAGCARDDEDELRARLDRWFEVEETLYFKSKKRCTVAKFRVESATPRDGTEIQKSPEAAKAQFRSGELAAVRMEAYSPHDVTDAMLLTGDGVFGKQALAAAAQSGPCFRGTKTEGALLEAMTRRGAMLAYDRATEGMIILDPEAMAVFYVAGDVW